MMDSRVRRQIRDLPSHVTLLLFSPELIVCSGLSSRESVNGWCYAPPLDAVSSSSPQELSSL